MEKKNKVRGSVGSTRASCPKTRARCRLTGHLTDRDHVQPGERETDRQTERVTDRQADIDRVKGKRGRARQS